MDRYAAALGLILLAIVVSALAGEAGWGRILSLLAEAVTLVFILRTSGARPRTLWLATGSVAVALGAAVAFTVLGGGSGAVASVAIGALLVLIAPAAIVHRLRRHERITGSTIFGALCLYLLAGLFFARVYAVIGALQHGGFFAQRGVASTGDFLYFSFVTLATLGYGDLTPRSDLGRMAAVAEALTGQLYLVSVVAVLVANVGRAGVLRLGRTDAAAPGPDGPGSPASAQALVEQVERLVRRHASGALSDEEFEAAKRRLLQGPS